MRPQVAVFLATSLDQFIARADGSIDWLHELPTAGEDHGYPAFWAGIDALVVGRSTWETALGFPEWPYAGKRVVVVTHRPLAATHGEETWSGPLTPLVERLGAEGVRRVYLDGGILVQQGLAEGLVDELTLTVVPRTLGTGRRLFGSDTPDTYWRLVSATPFPSGLVQLRYARG